jgi:FO synthase subunit 2
MMYGHVESDAHKARHVALLRDLQRATGGFTEFVPLSFIHTEAPMSRHGLVEGVRPGPTGLEVLKVHAISRIMLNNAIPNLQVSWVKEGLRVAQTLLDAGVSDLGGTLINESISTSAGAGFGQLVRPSEFRALIRGAGRVPAERTTTYAIRRRFDAAGDTGETPLELDLVTADPEERFGSYHRLIKADQYRYRHPRLAVLDADHQNR